MQRKLRITTHINILYPIHGTLWAIIVYVYSGLYNGATIVVATVVPL